MSTLRESVELVMRQTECYDVNIIQTKLAEHNNDVVATVCDIMNIGRPVKKADEFAEMRKILEEKDALFHKHPLQKSHTRG